MGRGNNLTHTHFVEVFKYFQTLFHRFNAIVNTGYQVGMKLHLNRIDKGT